MAQSARRHLNLLTVDLEEWFVVQALRGHYTSDDWTRLPSTIGKNTQRLLGLFRHYDVQATWFVLGWCADNYPDLIRQIANDGHEIACHSYRHDRVDQLTPDEFRRDTSRAIEAITKATGVRPVGYRAPSWSINGDIPWAFEILAELGFEYDSSIFPIKHDIYGMPEGPRQMFRMKCSQGRFLYEIPASTWRLFGKNMPIAGGGYLRHTPYWYNRWMVRRLNRRGQPANVYLHPWELDPDPPQIGKLSMSQRLRSYGSTNIFALKLQRLLSDFSFTTIAQYLKRQRQQPIGFR
ncbi:MAG: XrtA system polysaccharide deacetylase [bacterium]